MIWNLTRIRQNKAPRPRLPEATRIYAVGDVHGRRDLLDRLLANVEADIARRPITRPIVVFVGDYVDRGPNSSGVLERLLGCRGRFELVCLKGNHEAILLQFLNDPTLLSEWTRFGGLSTMLSYGLAPPLNEWSEDRATEIAAELHDSMPERHRQFLGRLALSFTCGDYFFAHAGVRAGIPLADQSERDLLWIREDFLLHEGLFDKIIVHGHTPAISPQVRPNRINIDTGAYATGRLTCLVLEADQIHFLDEILSEPVS